MFSSIRSTHFTPPSSAPGSTNLRRRRPRTISEPPRPMGDINENALNTSAQPSRHRYRPASIKPFSSVSAGRRLMQSGTQPNDDLIHEFVPINLRLAALNRKPANLMDIFNVEPDEAKNGIAQTSDKAPSDNGSVVAESQEYASNKATACRINGVTGVNVKPAPMQIMLRDIFAPFVTDENETEIEELIADRINGLSALKIEPKELERRLRIADRVDDITARFCGGFSSFGFIGGTQFASGVRMALETHLPAAALPFIPGLVIGVTDRFLSSLITNTHVGYYTKCDPDDLEDVMQRGLEYNQRVLSSEMTHQAGVLSSAYTLRNLARSIAAPIAAHFGQAALTDTLIDGVGGVPAGIFAEGMRNDGDRREMLMHPAYLLGRTNWRTQLQTLQHDTLSPQRFDDLKSRILSKLTEIPQLLIDACKSLFTLNSATEISLLTASLAGIEWVKTAIREVFEDSPPEASEFLANSLGTLTLGCLYYTLGVCMTAAARPTEAVDMALCRSNRSESAIEATTEDQQSPSSTELRRRNPLKTIEVQRY